MNIRRHVAFGRTGVTSRTKRLMDGEIDRAFIALEFVIVVEPPLSAQRLTDPLCFVLKSQIGDDDFSLLPVRIRK